MSVSLLATLAKNGVMDIGSSTRPIQEERDRFRTLTSGSMVVMGKKTFDMYGPVLGAYNIVITNKPINYGKQTVKANYTYHTVEEVIKFSEQANIIILGGYTTFHQFIKYADRIYITELDVVVDGNMYFPSLEEFVLDDITRYNYEGYSGRSLLTYVKSNTYIKPEYLNDKELFI